MMSMVYYHPHPFELGAWLIDAPFGEWVHYQVVTALAWLSPKENTMADEPKIAADPKDLNKSAARAIKVLWETGIIVADPLEPVLPHGTNRFIVNPNISDDGKLASAMRQALPDIVDALQGALPKP